MDNFLDLGHHERVYRINAHYRGSVYRFVGFTTFLLSLWLLSNALTAPVAPHYHDLQQLCHIIGG